MEDVVAQGLLREIPGVGGAIADIITKLHSTGNHPILRSMRKDVPVAVLEMLAVPGLRPDKVLKLYKEPGLHSLDELEQAANADRLRPVKKPGAALQSRMLQGIVIKRRGEGRRHLHRAAQLLDGAHRPPLMPRLRWRKAREAASK